MTIVLLVIFVLSAPRLIAADTLEKFFYVVLLVPALLCAAILFGVLKGSHARVRYKHLGWVIELGGPPALFALIVLGFYMVVPKTETFDLTVRPHGPQEQLIKRGALRLEFGNRSETEPLTDKGEADFKGIAHKFRGATLRVLPEIEGYERRYLDVLVSGDAVDLPLVPSPPPENALRGRLFPVPRSPQTVTVVVEGESETASVDAYGRFDAIVHRKLDEAVRLSVCSDGRLIYDDILRVSADETMIRTHAPGERCSAGLSR